MPFIGPDCGVGVFGALFWLRPSTWSSELLLESSLSDELLETSSFFVVCFWSAAFDPTLLDAGAFDNGVVVPALTPDSDALPLSPVRLGNRLLVDFSTNAGLIVGLPAFDTDFPDGFGGASWMD